MRLEIRDDHIKFPETLAEVTASVETFADLTYQMLLELSMVHMLG